MIKLIVLDVDGCLSDGKLTYTSDGLESKSFNVKDGLGISTWIKIGNHAAIITGKNSPMVERRARELGITHFYQGIKDKNRVIKELIAELGLKNYEVAAIGDDLNDYNMLRHVGRSFTPNDGMDDIKEIVDTVLCRKGGDGAVREMIDIIVKDNNQYEEFLGIWL
ncbi:HAD hydrolase family protein [Sulfurimonas lithotrophica]|uniref:3-deoxy-D-manno-octulosonate 8-phosphate phosphatase KdsC n=1 Tax=Sulfurimonas lithotrophica TaxID=2590022 RepID=A0A5P8P0P2_9BACT|nr:HAD hydrolase family protein [Sulfurimonas lithotrophica]QFR49273.1 HAD hydrolase family protein [Sulfurimonas lithotrophica]